MTFALMSLVLSTTARASPRDRRDRRLPRQSRKQLHQRRDPLANGGELSTLPGRTKKA
ncbi:hypothetical protein ABN034_21460 [Actinopolymorpha sp. B11F2]|uniref:hypothetical protein n=1 Tax=Actinopolymorpha sp. B11F2 TaxID=3160862 RepID=UPI0032E4E63C